MSFGFSSAVGYATGSPDTGLNPALATVAVWVYVAANDPDDRFLEIGGYGGSGPDGFFVGLAGAGVGGGEIRTTIWDSSFAVPEVFSETHNTGQWYHVAITSHATGSHKGFLDGVEVGNETGTTRDVADPDSRVSVGSEDGGGNYASGHISDFRIWHSILSDEDIASMASGTPSVEISVSTQWDGYQMFNEGEAASGVLSDIQGIPLNWVGNDGIGNVDSQDINPPLTFSSVSVPPLRRAHGDL